MCESNPLISVLLPVYNGEKYISQSIESILNQSYSNFELIIINDGSTDNSLEIINTYKDNRIRILNQVNKGYVKALNIGITYSIGKYIARMDQDDISCPDRFETQIKYLEKNKHISVLGGASKYIDENGQILGRGFTTTWSSSIKKVLVKKRGCLISHPTVMMRKKDLIAVDCYSEDVYKNLADYHLWQKFVQNNYKIVNLSKVLIHYRLVSESMSTTTAVKVFHGQLSSKLYQYNRLTVKEKEEVGRNVLLDIKKRNLSRRSFLYDNIENRIYLKFKILLGEVMIEKMISTLKNIYNFVKI